VFDGRTIARLLKHPDFRHAIYFPLGHLTTPRPLIFNPGRPRFRLDEDRLAIILELFPTASLSLWLLAGSLMPDGSDDALYHLWRFAPPFFPPGPPLFSPPSALSHLPPQVDFLPSFPTQGPIPGWAGVPARAGSD